MERLDGPSDFRHDLDGHLYRAAAIFSFRIVDADADRIINRAWSMLPILIICSGRSELYTG